MELHVEVSMTGAAFEHPYEAGRILRDIATSLDEGQQSGTVRDSNGNVCATYWIEEESK